MIGIEAKVYYSVGGVGVGTYNELAIVGEVTGSDARTKSEVKLRGSDVTLYDVGMRERAVTFQMLYEPTNAGFTAIKTAYASRADIGLAFLDEARAASVAGWEGDYKIASFSQPQQVDQTWMVDVEAVPSAKAGAIKPRDYVHSV